jgi:hypothetical protein
MNLVSPPTREIEEMIGITKDLRRELESATDLIGMHILSLLIKIGF